MISKLLVFLMFPLIANAQTSFVASEIDNPTNKCQVIVADYRVGSDINYLGNCSWSSLKGIGAYVEKWNHGNHVRVVRGNFKKGQSTDWSKVTYFNLLKKTVVSSEENSWLTRNRTVYQIDDVIADMRQSKVDIDLSKVSTYLVIANFIDLYE